MQKKEFHAKNFEFNSDIHIYETRKNQNIKPNFVEQNEESAPPLMLLAEFSMSFLIILSKYIGPKVLKSIMNSHFKNNVYYSIEEVILCSLSDLGNCRLLVHNVPLLLTLEGRFDQAWIQKKIREGRITPTLPPSGYLAEKLSQNKHQ